MEVLRLTIFAWVGAWVLGESLFPNMTYSDKLLSSILSAFVAGYANNLHGIFWGWLKKTLI